MRRIPWLRTFQLLSVSAFVLAIPQVAVACGCYPITTALDSYERSDLVVIARLYSVEKATGSEHPFGSDISSATMVVEQVFKGDVKINDKLTFAQGHEVVGCRWSFEGRPLGERYLLYLFKPEKPSDPWYISTCNGSGNVELAKDDLLYLNNMEQRRGQTRISGRVSVEGDLNTEGRKIRISGGNKTYFATIDKDGVYELYDVPPGTYTLEPVLPFGWKVDEFLLTRPPTRANFYRRPSNRVVFTLRPHKHFGVHIRLALNNHISGRVYDSRSKPLSWVCVSLVPTNDQSFIACNDLTDDHGRFRIDSVAAGTYFLIFNYEHKPARLANVPALYYPGVAEREKAKTITVKHGERVTGLKIVIN